MNQKTNSKLIIYFSIIFLVLSSCKDEGFKYTIESTLNPYKISPLTALLQIETNKPCSGSVIVLGETKTEISFNINDKKVNVPVVGLYPGKLNNLLVTFQMADKTQVDTIKIKTAELPNYFPTIEINKIDRNNMEPGLHLCDIHYAKQGTYDSRPMIFDDQGQVRWYLDLSFFGDIIWPIQRIKNGNLLLGGRNEIIEYDMLGKEIKKTLIDQKYRIHHDIEELPNGNLLIPVRKSDAFIAWNGSQINSFNDFIVLFDRKTSKVIKEWDLAKHLDVSRDNINLMTKSDWFHMNGIVFNEKDSSIIISGKNQGVVNITWNDELKWILAPKFNWGKSGRNNDGINTSSYLLTAINNNNLPYNNSIQLGLVSHENFDFPWGQHSPELLPNGNILLFDNGFMRNFLRKITYSRAVEYQVDDKDMTVKQIWQYGKERKNSFYSMLISNAKYLPKTKNILVTAGFINHYAKIVEVSYPEGKEIFEATLYFKTLNGKKTFAWGELDILYRSERMPLSY